MSETPQGWVLFRRETAHSAVGLVLCIGGCVQVAIGGQGGDQGIATVIIAAGKFGAGITGQPQDNARQGHEVSF